MKHYTLFLLIISCNIFAQNNFNLYTTYIQKHAPLAIEQQKKHKIPASITLAQGLLESGAGKGTLAVEANNHFGIKCHDWTGEKVYYDDDTEGECFRKYKDVSESYEDRSMFLLNRPRYASLFKLDASDYKGWAYGLKAAGYATDPNYPEKLIRLIENYDLQQYDKSIANNYTEKTTIYENNGKDVKRTDNTLDEYAHELYRNNGVKCTFSKPGDTYASIASEYNLSEDKILIYNDLYRTEKLQPNTVVYLQKKKKKSSSDYSFHIIQPGESMYRIAQKYAIKVQNLYDLNQMSYDKGAITGVKLKLR